MSLESYNNFFNSVAESAGEAAGAAAGQSVHPDYGDGYAADL